MADHRDRNPRSSAIGLARSAHHCALIEVSTFNPDVVPDTNRGLDNIQHVRGIWLDNDGGDLTPQEYARLFPYLRIVVWNTYHHTAQKPRWRVFSPTTLAMSKEIYRLITDKFEGNLNDHGYWTQKELSNNSHIKSRLVHGFDVSVQ